MRTCRSKDIFMGLLVGPYYVWHFAVHVWSFLFTIARNISRASNSRSTLSASRVVSGFSPGLYCIKKRYAVWFKTIAIGILFLFLSHVIVWSYPINNPNKNTLAAQSIFSALKDEGIEDSAELMFDLLAGIRLLHSDKTPRVVNSTLIEARRDTKDKRKIDFLDEVERNNGTTKVKFNVIGREDVTFEIIYQDTKTRRIDKNERKASDDVSVIDAGFKEVAPMKQLTYGNVFQMNDVITITKVNNFSEFQTKQFDYIRGAQAAYPVELMRILSSEPHESGRPSVILDLGCGKGLGAEWMNDHGFSVLGIDINEANIRDAIKSAEMGSRRVAHGSDVADALTKLREAESATVAYQKADLFQRIPLPDGSVDAIVLHRTLSQIIEVQKHDWITSEIYRVLKPGGFVSYMDFRDNEPEGLDGRYTILTQVIKKLLERGLLPTSIAPLLDNPEIQPVLVAKAVAGRTKYPDEYASPDDMVDAIEKGVLKIQYLAIHQSRALVERLFEKHGFTTIRYQEALVPRRESQRQPQVLSGFIARKQVSQHGESGPSVKTIPEELLGQPRTTNDITPARTMDSYNDIPRYTDILIDTVRQTVKEGYLSLSADQIHTLDEFQAELAAADTSPITPLPADYPGAGRLNHRIRKYRNWRDNIPIVLAHLFIQHRVLSITGYWDNRIDCFASTKVPAAEEAIKNFSDRVDAFLTTPEVQKGDNDFILRELIINSLMGNKADLANPIGDKSLLLANDIEKVIRMIRSKECKQIDIFVDNTGEELLADLWKIWFLIKNGFTKEVVLHAHYHPLFVSDATAADVDDMINRLVTHENGASQQMGRDLVHFRESGSLTVREDTWIIDGRESHELKREFQQEFAHSDLIIVKGEFLYQFFLGSRYHPYNTDLNDLVRDFGLPRFLFLRMMKTEIGAGLDIERIRALESENPEWYKQGYGLIQLTSDYRRTIPAGIASEKGLSRLEERRLFTENRDEEQLLARSAKHLKGYQINEHIDLSAISAEGLTSKQARGQLERNMNTLARMIAWHNTYNLDIRYILENDTPDGLALRLLREKIKTIFSGISGINVEELLVKVGTPHQGDDVIEVLLRTLESIEKMEEVGDNEYVVGLKDDITEEGVSIPNYTAASNIGLSLAALRIVKDKVKETGDYERARQKIFKIIKSIYERYNIIGKDDDFTVDDLEFMVTGCSENRLRYAILYALPPIAKDLVDRINRYHERMQFILRAA